MAPTTTPPPDDTPPNEHRPAPGAGPDDPVRLILTADELVAEGRKHHGQRVIVGRAMRPIGEETYFYLEFADGTRIEVMGR